MLAPPTRAETGASPAPTTLPPSKLMGCEPACRGHSCWTHLPGGTGGDAVVDLHTAGGRRCAAAAQLVVAALAQHPGRGRSTGLRGPGRPLTAWRAALCMPQQLSLLVLIRQDAGACDGGHELQDTRETGAASRSCLQALTGVRSTGLWCSIFNGSMSWLCCLACHHTVHVLGGSVPA